MYCCSTCGKECISPSKLKRHERVHTGEKPFKCDHCQKNFSRKDNLESHMSGHVKKTYHCEICKKTFQRQVYLYKHRKCHRNIEKFRCDKCPTSFTRLDNLKRHKQNRHNNPYQMRCSYCKKKFIRLDSLLRHKYQVHKRRVIAECHQCGRQFKDKPNFVRHKRIRH